MAQPDPFGLGTLGKIPVAKAPTAKPVQPKPVLSVKAPAAKLAKTNQGLSQALQSVANTVGTAKLKTPPKPGLRITGLPSNATPAQADAYLTAHHVVHLNLAAAKQAQAQKNAAMLAPVLNVLNQTTRPLHAIAGGIDAAVTHQPVGRAIVRGIENKDHTTFSRVLKDVGAPKAVQTVGGFAGDVLGDPTTYLTFGAGSVAKKALVDAADSAAAKAAVREAAPSGLTVKVAGHEVPGVRRATGAIVGRVAKKAGSTRPALAVRDVLADVNPNIAPAGVSKYAHQQATSIARTTRATVSKAQRDAQAHGVALKKAIGADSQRVIDAVEAGQVNTLPPQLRDAAQHYTDTQAALHAREHAAGLESDTVGQVVPHVVPALPDREATLAAVKAAQRERVNAEVAHKAILSAHDIARGRAQVLSRTVGGRAAEQAAEKDTRYAAGGLGVRQAADAIAASGRRVAAARQAVTAAEATHAAALGTRKEARRLTIKNTRLAAQPQGYVPHFTTESLQAGKPGATIIGGRKGVGKATVRIVSQQARNEGRNTPLAALRVSHPGAYSEDLPLLAANRRIIGETGIAQAEANQRLAQLGRPYTEHSLPTEGEAVFRHKGSDMAEVTDPRELARARKGYSPDGAKYVVLNRKVVEKGRDVRGGAGGKSAIGRGYDRLQGGFKATATATPAFHIRNLIGDTQNAYLAQPGHRMPGNLARSGKTLRALKRTEEAQRTLGATAKPMRGGVKIDGKSVTYEQLAHEAAGVGAIRAGFQNRELGDLLHPGQGAVKKVSEGSRAGRAVKRTAQSREDLPRLSTYIEARRKGMDPEAAAQYVAEHHFDYGNLTNFERNVARRAMPFYTFSARNIPLQTRKLIQKPGKFATYQKVREEAATAAGLKPGYESGESQSDQRNAGVPVKIGGKVYNLNAGLPITDINETPGAAGINPLKQAAEYGNKAATLITPLVKDPVEVWANYSTFRHAAIKDRQHQLVAAPAGVEHLGKTVRDALHVTQVVDKRSGKKTWQWDPYADYAVHAVPGLAALVTKAVTSKPGTGIGSQLIGATGIKATPVDPAGAILNGVYDALSKAQDRLAVLSQQGIVGASSNAERQSLNARVKQLDQAIYQLKAKRGDKILPKAGAPSASGGWGDSGSGWGGPVSSSATSAGWGPQPKAGSAASGGWGP